MPSLAFATTGKYQWQDRLRFARFSRSEYYEAELDCGVGRDTLDLRIESGLAGPYFVGGTTAGTPYLYRRNQAHIERDHADICILHYLVNGTMRTLHNGVRARIEPGQYVILRSNSPYVLEYEPGSPAERAMYYASLPPDLVLRHFSGRSIFGHVLAPTDDHRGMADRLFSFIFDNGERIAPEVGGSLLSALLKDVARIPLPAEIAQPRSTSVPQFHLDRIRSYLALHFTNPDLTATMAAQACNISPRYLSHVLARTGTSFSTIIWQMRMGKARQWLESAWLEDVSVASFAFQAGYKSSSHFIHAFKKHSGCTPGEYRRRHRASHCGNEMQDDTLDFDMALSDKCFGQPGRPDAPG